MISLDLYLPFLSSASILSIESMSMKKSAGLFQDGQEKEAPKDAKYSTANLASLKYTIFP
jgi:hypothetical protein